MPGIFTLSIDFELAWGEFYRRPVDTERMLAARAALPRLLELLDRHRIPATFAVVGHLLLEGCEGHPEHPRAEVAWRGEDWFVGDPQTDEAHDPAWYAPSLVRAIAAAGPGHDLGSHGFSHVPLDDPAATAEVAAAEIGASAQLHRQIGHAARSFVYPRNGIGHRGLLAEHGFTSYRGVEPQWYNRRCRPLRRVAHMVDQCLAVTPPVAPVVAAPRDGCVELPGSMLFLSREGFRRFLPIASRVLRARRGLGRLEREPGRVFHLWLHVEDLVPDTARMLDALDAVFASVRRAVDRDMVTVRTMAELAAGAEA